MEVVEILLWLLDFTLRCYFILLYSCHLQLSWDDEDLVEEIISVYHGRVVQVIDSYPVLHLGDECRCISVLWTCVPVTE